MSRLLAARLAGLLVIAPANAFLLRPDPEVVEIVQVAGSMLVAGLVLGLPLTLVAWLFVTRRLRPITYALLAAPEFVLGVLAIPYPPAWSGTLVPGAASIVMMLLLRRHWMPS